MKIDGLDVEPAVEVAAASIAERLRWPSVHWGVEEVHPDAWPHIALAAITPLVAEIRALHAPFVDDHDGHIAPDPFETCRDDHQIYPCATIRLLDQTPPEDG